MTMRRPKPEGLKRPDIKSWTDIDTSTDVAQKVAAAHQAVAEHIGDLCVELGLGLSIRHETPDVARRFFIVLNGEVLLSADDPTQVEYYLYGWRDRIRCATENL